MSNRCKVLVVLALVVAARSSPAADNGPLDAQQFLRDNGLAEYHAMCVEFVSELARGKPETAAEVLIKSMPARASEEDRDAWTKGIVRASPDFTQGIQDMEFVGFSKVSSRLMALHYVVHGNTRPVLLRFMAYRIEKEGAWRTHNWTIEMDIVKILEMTKVVTRFPAGIMIPLPDRKHSKRTALPARGRDGDRSMVSAAVGCRKGDSHHLCEAPFGPFRQMVAVTFSAPRNFSPKNGPVSGRTAT